MSTRLIFAVVGVLLTLPVSTPSVFAEELGPIFFNGEQRRVLEAVRQGVLDEDALAIESFTDVPVISSSLSGSGLPSVPTVRFEEVDIPVDVSTAERTEDLNIQGFVKAHGTGRMTYWINGQTLRPIDLGNLGIEFTGNKGVALEGVDASQRNKIEVKAGQIITPNGEIIETLPVINPPKESQRFQPTTAAADSPTEGEPESNADGTGAEEQPQ